MTSCSAGKDASLVCIPGVNHACAVLLDDFHVTTLLAWLQKRCFWLKLEAFWKP